MDPRGYYNNDFGHAGAYNESNGGYQYPHPPPGQPTMPLRRHLGGARGEHEFFPGPPPPLHYSPGPERVAPIYVNPAAAGRGIQSQGPAPAPLALNPEAGEFVPKLERAKIKEEAKALKKAEQKAEKAEMKKAEKKKARNKKLKANSKAAKERRAEKDAKIAGLWDEFAKKDDDEEGQAETKGVDVAEEDGDE